jgi:hypothetical protein
MQWVVLVFVLAMACGARTPAVSPSAPAERYRGPIIDMHASE